MQDREKKIRIVIRLLNVLIVLIFVYGGIGALYSMNAWLNKDAITGVVAMLYSMAAFILGMAAIATVSAVENRLK